MTLSRRSVFERYQKNENDIYVIAIVSDEIIEDSKVVATTVKEIPILESDVLGTSWDESTICSKYSLIRRASLIQPELQALETQAKLVLESIAEAVTTKV